MQPREGEPLRRGAAREAEPRLPVFLLSRLPQLLRVARKTCRIAKENIIFALGVKAVCLVLGALGYAPMWLAIFADVGVAMLAILNSLRAMRQ